MGVKLNSSQLEAVQRDSGASLVVAGAGTGKTSVIVERIISLLRSGVSKSEILALTFTEKAASEMLDRVSDSLVESYGLDLHIHTFNAFGADLLGEFGVEIGFNSSPKLLGDQGKLVVLREHIDQLGLDYFAPISDPTSQLGNLADYYSKLKQQLVKPEAYIQYAHTLPEVDDAEKLEKIRHTELAMSYKKYLEICQGRGFIDYDDQIYQCVQLLEKRPNIQAKLQARFKHILVDEFQDTNPMQSKMIDLIYDSRHSGARSLMVVGDDDQSIYGWRGATLSNILGFTNRYPGTKLITLTENYRSTQYILDAAYILVQNNNPNRLEHINAIDKKLIASRGAGLKPIQKSFMLLDSELDFVAKDIQNKIKSGIDPGKIAVLARRAHGVQKAHEALELRGIEHSTIGITSNLYEQPIIQTMIQALRCIVDPRNNMSLYHTLGSVLFGIDPTVLSGLSSISRKKNITLEEALEPDEDQEVHSALTIIKSWQAGAPTLSIGKMAYAIITDTGLKDKILTEATTSTEGELSAQALFQWFRSLNEFQKTSEISTTTSYLETYEAIRADGELLTDDTAAIDESKPVVMTIHKSKGLEWEHVYIIDCTEGSLPLARRGSSLIVPEELSRNSEADDHYSEERRLMYVAMTRARDSLSVTYSQSHNGTSTRKPSRFITEIFGETLSPNEEATTQQASLELFAKSTTAHIGLPSKFTNGQDLVLSASQVNDYIRCPLDFYYRHILGTPADPSPHAEVGTVFHSLIQQLQLARIAGSSLPTKEMLLRELTQGWPEENYISKVQRDRAMKLGHEAFDTLYDRILTEPVPLAVEKPFRIRVPNSKLILRGRIDAIYPGTHGVEIRDYKTSIVKDSTAAKQKATASKQLEMYALAYRVQYDEMPTLLSLDFVQSGVIGSVKKQAKTLDNLENKLATIADDILSYKYPPGTDHDYCRHP